MAKNTVNMVEVDDEELPFPSEKNTNVVIHKGYIAECPFCMSNGREGKIFEGDSSYYCSNATKKNGKVCNFVLYKNNVEKLIRRSITVDEVKDLCEEGRFSAVCTKIEGDETYDAYFTPVDKEKYISLKLNFPEG